MPTFTTNNSAVSVLASELIQSALRKLGISAQGETVTAEDSAWVLEELQRLIDRTNARREMIYNVNFSKFTLLTNTQPITIGPSGQFAMNQRPVRLEAASLVLTSSSPNVEIPIRVRDDDWWAAQTIKGLPSTLPTDVYYSPDTPLGNLNFWPIPTSVNDVRLETWVNLTQAIDASTALAMPPAYWDYIVMTLARDASPSYGPEAIAIASSAPFQATLNEARRAVMDNNTESVRMVIDGPRNQKSGVRPGFNFLTGLPR